MARSGGSAQPEANDATPLTARVFAQLCDGRFHSGEQLAQALGVSRSAIWKAARIRERLAPEVRDHVRSVEATWSTASTNSVLLGRANPPSGTSEVFLTE